MGNRGQGVKSIPSHSPLSRNFLPNKMITFTYLVSSLKFLFFFSVYFCIWSLPRCVEYLALGEAVTERSEESLRVSVATNYHLLQFLQLLLSLPSYPSYMTYMSYSFCCLYFFSHENRACPEFIPLWRGRRM